MEIADVKARRYILAYLSSPNGRFPRTNLFFEAATFIFSTARRAMLLLHIMTVMSLGRLILYIMQVRATRTSQVV